MVLMNEENTGNNLVWFASNNPEFNNGDRYKLKGTVKTHNVRDGKNQTVLTRCKVA